MLDRDRPLCELLRAPPPVPAERLWRQIERRRHQLPLRTGWIALAPALGFAVAALYFWPTASPESEAAPSLRLADGDAIGPLTATQDARRFTLSDGSQIDLSPGAKLVPRALGDHEFTSELVSGKALFDVMPHGPRTWRIRAGIVQVQVLGTRFSVERRGRFTRVAVERGAVQVTAPGVDGEGRTLRAGESICSGPQPTAAGAACLAAMTTESEHPSPTRSDLPNTPVPPDSALTPTNAANAESTNPVPMSPRPDGADDDTTATARQEPRLHDARAQVETLLRAADAARAAGQASKAAAILKRIVDQHASDPSAGLAAFTLGRLYLDTLAEPARAARAFQRARELGLPQSLTEEGAARSVEAYAKAGQHERALAAAAEYRTHFPNGARAAAVARFAEQR